MSSFTGVTTEQMGTLGSKLLGSVFSAVGQNQQAENALEAQQAQIDANAKQAYEQTVTLRQNQMMEREKLAREKLLGQLKGEKEKSLAIVASGESGVYGNATNAYLGTFDQAMSDYKESVTRQQQLSDYATNTQAANIIDSALARQQGMQKKIYNRSWTTLFGGLADTYADYKKYEYSNKQPIQ